MDLHNINELLSSWVENGQSKTNEVTPQKEAKIKPIPKESIFERTKQIKKKIEKKNKKDINDEQTIIKKQNTDKESAQITQSQVSNPPRTKLLRHLIQRIYLSNTIHSSHRDR